MRQRFRCGRSCCGCRPARGFGERLPFAMAAALLSPKSGVYWQVVQLSGRVRWAIELWLERATSAAPNQKNISFVCLRQEPGTNSGGCALGARSSHRDPGSNGARLLSFPERRKERTGAVLAAHSSGTVTADCCDSSRPLPTGHPWSKSPRANVGWSSKKSSRQS